MLLPPTISHILALIPLLYYATTSSMSIASFISCPKLCKLLHCWEDYVLSLTKFFHKSCSDKGIPNYKRVDNLSKRLVKASLLFFTGFQLWIIFLFRRCLFSTVNKCSADNMEHTLVHVIVGPVSFLYATLDQVRLAVAMQVVLESLSQISAQMLSDREISTTNAFIKPLPIIGISQLLYLIKKQVKLLQESVKFSQLFFVGYFFAGSISTWVMFLFMLKGQAPIPLVGTTMLILLTQGTAFWMFARLSERIENEKSKLLGLLLRDRLRSRKLNIEVRYTHLSLMKGFGSFWNIQGTNSATVCIMTEGTVIWCNDAEAITSWNIQGHSTQAIFSSCGENPCSFYGNEFHAWEKLNPHCCRLRLDY